MLGTMLVTGATVAKMANDLKKSDELKERAVKKRRNAYQAIAQAEAEKIREEEKMNQAVSRLITRKKGILITSIKQFLEIYGKIKKINFRETDGIKELNNFTPACCEEIHNQLVIIQQKNYATSVVTKNVIKGFLFSGIGGAVTASIVDDAENELNMAKDKARQALVIAEQKKIYSLSYRGITERVSRMAEILTMLNQCFVKSITNTERIVKEKGTDREEYTLDDISQIGVCLNLAKAIKDILDAPILDKDGKLSRETLDIIEKGNQCIIDMKDSLSNV